MVPENMVLRRTFGGESKRWVEKITWEGFDNLYSSPDC
jgi:hypothetical protein